MPRYKSPWASTVFLCAFIAIANLPDWPLPGWGHSNYKVSHSIFVNLALIIICVLLLRIKWGRARFVRSTGRRPEVGRAVPGNLACPDFTTVSWGMIIGGAAAWLSHLLLDSFYNHGLGIAIFWPFSTARLALPMPWFHTWSSVPPPLNADTFYICLVETLFYGPILLLAIGWRYWRSANSGQRPELK